MKSLLLVLAFLPALASAARIEGPRFVKQLDGGIAYCNQIEQAGNPAYYPTALEVTSVGESIRFQAPVSFVSCAELDSNKFGWIPRNPLDPVPARDIEGRNILKYSESNEFVLINNQISIVGTQSILNLPGQTADFLVPLDKALSPEQKITFNQGYRVEARFTFFTRGNVYVVDAGGSRNNIGLRSGGAYSVLVTLERNRISGALEVFEVKFRP